MACVRGSLSYNLFLKDQYHQWRLGTIVSKVCSVNKLLIGITWLLLLASPVGWLCMKGLLLQLHGSNSQDWALT